MKIKAIRKLGKNSKYSYGIIIPPEIVRGLRFKEKQKLVITGDTRTRKIVICDWPGKNRS